MSDPEAVIRTEALSKTYPTGVLAVDDLELSVYAGEIFGLLGPNGAGKTTTVGMLTTRVIPTGGSAWIAGIDVVAHPTATKRVIGVVSQTNTLDRSLTVVGEPVPPREVLRDVDAGRRASAPTSSWSGSVWPTGPTPT